MSVYSNSSSSSYARLGDPYRLLEFSSSNCCRMAPYVKCTHCFSKCDSCCKGILQGARGSFAYDLAGSTCNCDKIPNAIQSCQGDMQGDVGLGCSTAKDAGLRSCGRAGGLKCKYY